MPIGMYWYNGGSWKKTEQLWAYQSSTWKEVQECWIWDGLGWNRIYNNAKLVSVQIEDTSCDPTLGNIRFSFTTSGDVASFTIDLQYRFGAGSWNTLDNNIDATTSPYTATLDGLGGFTSLDDTTFRAALFDGAELVTDYITISGPPYACG